LTWQLVGLGSLGLAVLVGACGMNNDAPPLGGGPGTDNDASGGGCGTPNTGCPCSSDGDSVDCGEVKSVQGDYVTCSIGKRICSGGSWGPCVAEYTAVKSTGALGGDIHTLGLGEPSPEAGSCGTNYCDPTCNSFPDNSNGVDGGPGLQATPDGGWTLPLTGGSSCSGLQCQVPSCPSGQTTSITGTVYDPAALNPVFNAVVMIPNGPVAPVPAGVSSDPCGGATLPSAVSYAYTAADGTFTLTGVPVGNPIPLVIQIGRWRRSVNLDLSGLTCGNPKPISSGCAGANNYAGTAGCLTRLPRTQSEGNIPHIALGTGGLDAMECMLYRMGVDSSEYTDENGAGRIHVFNNGGAVLAAPNANHDISYLLGFTCAQGFCAPTANNLTSNYDLVMLPCDGGAEYGASRWASVTTGITNPGFDTGDFTGWTTAGTRKTVVSGTYTTWPNSAQLGTLNPCVYSNTNTATQSALVAPANATQFQMDYGELCSGNNNYGRVAMTDNTSGGTVQCQDCTWGYWNTCTLPVTGGHSYTLSLTNQDTVGSGACSETFFDNARWVDPTADDPGRTNLVNYAAVGGRIFTSHWGREWIERPSSVIPAGPFPGVATWYGDGNTPWGGSNDPDTGYFDTSFPRGANLAAWMNVVTGNGATMSVSPTRFDLLSVTAASRRFVYDWSDNNPGGHPNNPDSVFDFTFDTPVGATTQPGRVMYTDMHLANGNPWGTFPNNCPTQGSSLLQQEDAAEYLLFDLGACASGTPVNPPTYHTATFTRDFDSVCASGFKAVWRYFYYQDATPSDTNIVFTAATADTQAQLGTQFAAVPLITASGPDNCPPGGGPSCAGPKFLGVNVDPQLVAAGDPVSGQPPTASHEWLRVTMTLNPSSDQLSAPTLIAWEQTYDCVPAE
jgi:hypothetical protein